MDGYLSRLDDERLAKLSAGDGQQAFAALYERHHQALFRYCATIVRDDSDAQDALQATWMHALVALRRGQRDAPLRPWLYRIAHNESVSILRRRGHAAKPLRVPACPPTSAEDRAVQRERLAQLVADLGALPERPRSALVLRELAGLSHQEIALALQTTVAAAKQSIYEARCSLHDLAQGRTMACADLRRRVSDGDGRVLRARCVRAHMRQCPECAAFAAAIADRPTALAALVPMLPVAASWAILRRAVGSGAGGGASAGAGATAVGGGAAAAAGKVAGIGLAAKSLAVTGLALTVAAVTVTVTGVTAVTGSQLRAAPSVSRAAHAEHRAAAVAPHQIDTVVAQRPSTVLTIAGAIGESATTNGDRAAAAHRGAAHRASAIAGVPAHGNS
ncbi:MAG: RNA polymerase sigma factor, partial [Solirubrobacteraceae bacterium]